MNVSPDKRPKVQLPKDALKRINLGQSFAEYDKVLSPAVFVKTPSIEAATEPLRSKCFFVGRRGTGKTAITYYLQSSSKWAFQLHPQALVPASIPVDQERLRDTRQRHFRTLTSCFKRALLDEAISEWSKNSQVSLSSLPSEIRGERNVIEDYDFDGRLLKFFQEALHPLEVGNEKEWLKLINRPKIIAQSIEPFAGQHGLQAILMIDRIDEAWDNTDLAVLFLIALMHSCVELSSAMQFLRPLLFLRENIFERVRQLDPEFSRLETCVVSLDWTEELLLQMIERRLNLPFNTKLPLGGATWDYFFESLGDGKSSRHMVFDYCQLRPRDVLTYCTFAIENAKSHLHEKILFEDLHEARRRFSDSRLKDLGDEYSENYPQIQLVLSRFYGLGRAYTLEGIASLVRKLLAETEIKKHCANWIYNYVAPEKFMELLYNIGFWGLKEEEQDSIIFRSMGVRASNPPRITPSSMAVIHPTFSDALNLHDTTIRTLGQEVVLQGEGVIFDLPEGVTLASYISTLNDAISTLEQLPKGKEWDEQFEDLVMEIIRYCFVRALGNPEKRVRDQNGTVIRDIVTSNIASGGFWEIVRNKYGAVQVVWECKNYEDLKADDFHQTAYYMTPAGGKFVVLVFRGEMKKHYFQHIKRIHDSHQGIVLVLNERDLKIFLRQAVNGKVKESHIQETYDRTIRTIS